MKDVVNKYNDLLEEVEDLRIEIEELESSIEVNKESISGIDNSINEITNVDLGANSPLIAKEFARLMNEYNKINSDKIKSVNDEKQCLLKEMESKKNAVSRDISNSMKGVEELNKLYDRIQNLSNVGDYLGDVEVPPETISDLKLRIGEFEKFYKNNFKNNKTFVGKVADVVSLNDVFKGIDNKRVALCCMTGYLLGITIIVCKFPIVFLAGYTTLTAFSIRDSFSRRELVNTAKIMYKAICQSYSNCQEMIKNEYDEKSSELLQNIDDEYKIKLDNINEVLKQIHKEYSDMIKELQEKRKDPEAFKGILEKANSRLNRLKGNKDRYIRQIDSDVKELNDKRDELEELEQELRELKQKISKYYIRNLTCGKDRLMIKTFFTGFNQDESASLIEFNGNTTVICYSGADSSCNNNLSLLFATQVFTSVSIGSLRLEVFDINQGAQRFAPYTADKLADVVHINRTPEQVTDTIKNIHAMIEERSRIIYALAENIEEYNKSMIAKNSLTMDYTLLIVQDAGSTIYSNDKFIQLCKTGPPLGIIPIIMLSMEAISTVIVTANTSDASTYLTFLKSITTPLYIYNNSNDSITKAQPNFKGDYVNELEKVLKGVK